MDRRVTERIYKSPKLWAPGTEITAQVRKIGTEPQTVKLIVGEKLGAGFGQTVVGMVDDQGNGLVGKIQTLFGFKSYLSEQQKRELTGIPSLTASYEPAITVAEGVDLVLATACNIKARHDPRFRSIVFPQSHGHFFDSTVGANLRLFERVPVEKDRLPISGSEAEARYLKVKDQFDALAQTSDEVGFGETKRQFEWWTLVARDNATVVDPKKSRLVVDDSIKYLLYVLDTVPGVAVTSDLILSPGDVSIARRLHLQGKRYHFDQIDFDKLHRFIEKHPNDFLSLQPVIAEMEKADALYRDAIPGPIFMPRKQFFDSEKRQVMREAAAGAFKARKYVDDETADKIRDSDKELIKQMAIFSFPVIGGKLMRLLSNTDYRKHWKEVFTNSEYRHMLNQEIIDGWEKAGKITPAQADKLRNDDLLVLAVRAASIIPDRVTLLSGAKDLAQAIVRPGLIIGNRGYRQQWIESLAEKGIEDGLIDEEMRPVLHEQATSKKADSLAKDLVINTVGSTLVSAYLGAEIMQYGAESGNMFLTLFGMSQLPGVPKLFSLGGTVFSIPYLTARAIQDRVTDGKDAKLSKTSEALTIPNSPPLYHR